MLTRLFVIALSFTGLHAAASNFVFPTLETVRTFQSEFVTQAQVSINGLEDWVVGDTANYKFQMGFLSGTMMMKVRESVEEGFWVDQDVDAGFFGKQKVEMLVDKHTGRLLRLIVNGKEEQIPEDDGNTEIVEAREDKVTVTAGTFDCIYVKMLDKTKNETSEAWINPSEIPVMGLIKTKQPGQMGEMVMELTSFQKM